jgi:hypothetical protein
MKPAHIRVDPWVWSPLGQRKGGLLMALIIGAACAVTVFIAERQYYQGDATPAATAEVAKNSAVRPGQTREAADLPDSAPSPTAEVVAKNSAVKPGDTGEEATLALEGENGNASTEQAKPSTPHVSVINPGAVDQKANSRTQAPAQVHTHPPLSTPPADNDVRPVVRQKKASEDRRFRRGMQSYQDLRDYVLRR